MSLYTLTSTDPCLTLTLAFPRSCQSVCPAPPPCLTTHSPKKAVSLLHKHVLSFAWGRLQNPLASGPIFSRQLQATYIDIINTDTYGLGKYDGLGEYYGLNTASEGCLNFTTQLYSYLCYYNICHILTRGKYCIRNTPNPQYFPLLTSGG